MVFGGKGSENREKNKIKSNLFFIPRCSTLRLSAMMGVTNVVKTEKRTKPLSFVFHRPCEVLP